VIPLASIPFAASASAAVPPGPTATIRVGSATNSAGSKASDLSKLTKAAGEFESILLESLWKSMKETFSYPDEDADPTLKSFDDWGIQAMANAVGNSGGLGIKNMILKYLEPTVSGGGGSVSAR
jgi:Rod binding domain-containing protein